MTEPTEARALRVGLVGAARPAGEVAGAERLAAALTERGHRVIGVPSRRARLPRLSGLHLYEDGIEAVAEIVLGLRRSRLEIAHAIDPAAGWAAARCRRRGGPPYVLAIERTLDRAHLVARRRRIEMLREAASGAALVAVPSEAAAQALRRYAIADPLVLADWWGAAACENLYREALSR